MTETQTLRPELPPLPPRVARLPRDRGYPVPWFVPWVDGKPEFRVMARAKISVAALEQRCWVCGQKLGRYRVYVTGPMGMINRVSGEPASHYDCGTFSARACPHLMRPYAKRRSAGMPEGATANAGASHENPGMALVWMTEGDPGYRVDRRDGSVIFQMGEPREFHFYTEGREATGAEILVGLERAAAKIRMLAAEEGPRALAQFERSVQVATDLVKTKGPDRSGPPAPP